MTHCRLTPAEVWVFLAEGCNLAEIAAYAGVSLATALAMMQRARLLHAVPRTA